MTKFYFSWLIALTLLSCTGSNKTKEKSPRVAVCSGTKVTDKDWYTSKTKAPLFKGLHGIDFEISTSNKKTQEYFNQGMMLSYGFNHAEAARSFYEAARLDSNCAMAYWGYAYVLGPNYNGGMEEDNYQRAYDATIKAKSLSASCTSKEISLINALMKRYEAKPTADRTHLDIAYAGAMKKVYKQYPGDPDVGALYAESMMNLHPWDLYDSKTKKPKLWTPELVAVLEHLIKSNPKHPGAHHFYIHALEASSTPESALASAHLLSSLVPGSGHLLHMPSHIYINTGDYHLGTLSNLRAIAVDSIYTAACHAQGVYPLAYYPHNYHFLAATATLEGNAKLAWIAAKKLQKHTATDIMGQPKWGTLQHYYTIPYYIAIKFNMLDSILSLPAPPKNLIYPKAIWHYAKGLAYLGKNDIVNAQKESNVLRMLSVDTSLQRLTVWDINTTADLAKIANNVLAAGIAAKQNHLSKSITLLTQAIGIEDNLNYNEPPDWFFSIRHHLGTVLIRSGKYSQAEKIYRQDLQKWKKNGWALIGLYNSLMLQKKVRAAQNVKFEFDQAWKYADAKITSSSTVFN